MVQYIKDELKLEWKEYFAVVFSVQFVTWLLVEGIAGALLGEAVMAGGAAAAGMGLFLVVVMAWGHGAAHFDMQLRMGRTRRDAYLSLFASQLVLGVCAALFSYALSWLSEAVGALTIGAQRGENAGLIVLTKYAPVCAAALVCGVAAGLLTGGLTQRFGRRAFWVIYAVLVLIPMLLTEHLIRLFLPDTGALGFVTRALMPLGAAAPALLLAAGGILCAVIGWLVLRRASVRA